MTTLTEFADLDLFSDQILDDPYPAFRQLRDTAPAVYLPQLEGWAISRYDGVREVLGDWERFSAAQGVGFNDAVNTAMVGTVLASDPPLHDTLRGVLAESLSPRAVRSLRAGIEDQAIQLVERLVDRGSFDAVTDLAQIFPPWIVTDLVGLPQDIRPRLLPWGDAIFNTLGPANERMINSVPDMQEMFGWVNAVHPSELTEGSMGRAIFDAVDAGVIEPASGPQLMAAYVSAAMDTTVNSIGSAVWLFATHPDQWQALREDRSLIPGAFNEVLRCESPIYQFARVTTTEVDLDGTTVPADARLIVLYGSGNRDERHYGDTADSFDITRDAADHLAFGYGLHGCAGQGLARLEAHALFNALADRVDTFTQTGPLVRHLNNTVRGLESFPVAVTPAS